MFFGLFFFLRSVPVKLKILPDSEGTAGASLICLNPRHYYANGFSVRLAVGLIASHGQLFTWRKKEKNAVQLSHATVIIHSSGEEAEASFFTSH